MPWPTSAGVLGMAHDALAAEPGGHVVAADAGGITLRCSAPRRAAQPRWPALLRLDGPDHQLAAPESVTAVGFGPDVELRVQPGALLGQVGSTTVIRSAPRPAGSDRR